MAVRREVEDLLSAGILPPEDAATEHDIEEWQRLLERVNAPVSDEEAQKLVGVFGSDSCFGVAWTVLQLD